MRSRTSPATISELPAGFISAQREYFVALSSSLSQAASFPSSLIFHTAR